MLLIMFILLSVSDIGQLLYITVRCFLDWTNDK